VTRLGCAVLNWFGKVRRELVRGGSWFGGSWFGLKGDDVVAGGWPKDDDASWLGGVGVGSC